jgi:hypothetical protein
MENLHKLGLYCHPTLLVICTSTLSELFKEAYTVARRRVLKSAPLQSIA